MAVIFFFILLDMKLSRLWSSNFINREKLLNLHDLLQLRKKSYSIVHKKILNTRLNVNITDLKYYRYVPKIIIIIIPD